MDNPLPLAHTMTWTSFKAARRLYLISQYPNISREEITMCVISDSDTWIQAIQRLPREATITMEVGRSLVALIGHAEASRMTRHLRNFPSFLPRVSRNPNL